MGIVSSLVGNVESLTTGMSARRGGSLRKLWRSASRNTAEARMARVKGGTITRQRRRAASFEAAFAEISKRFPGEPRHARRNMARNIMHREWHKTGAR
jgi:hypothetical protein